MWLYFMNKHTLMVGLKNNCMFRINITMAVLEENNKQLSESSQSLCYLHGVDYYLNVKSDLC
jgi:hypothetical protein